MPSTFTFCRAYYIVGTVGEQCTRGEKNSTTKMEKGEIFLLHVYTDWIEYIFDRFHFFLNELNEYLINNADYAPFADLVKIN